MYVSWKERCIEIQRLKICGHTSVGLNKETNEYVINIILLFPHLRIFFFYFCYFYITLCYSYSFYYRYHVNCEARYFEKVMNFLRDDGRIKDVDMKSREFDGILHELMYFNLPTNIDLFLPLHMCQAIKEWLPGSSFRLLYKATRYLLSL